MAYRELKAAATIVLDERYKRDDNKNPVKLRITYLGEQRYYSIPDEDDKANGSLFLSLDDFYTVISMDEVSRAAANKRREDNNKKQKDKNKKRKPIPEAGRLTKRLETIQLRLNTYKAKAIEAINQTNPFTWDSFQKNFYPGKPTQDTLQGILHKFENEHKEAGTYGTSQTYYSARRCLDRYVESLKSVNSKKGTEMKVYEVTESFIKKWRVWMEKESEDKKPLSGATIGIYFRCVRAAMNHAIKENMIKRDQYPFANKGMIPTSGNIKKALSAGDIARIYQYPTTNANNSKEEWSRDMFMLSFFSNGINIKDIARMRWHQIKNDTFTFIRSKTKKSNAKPIKVILIPEALAIIDKWSQPKNMKLNNYVFDILPAHLKGSTEEIAKAEYMAIRQAVQTINKNMNRICTKLGIEEKVTSYFSRHSWASISRDAGVSVSFISAGLGHTTTAQTDNYLDEIDDKTRRENAEKIRPVLTSEAKKSAG